MKNFAFGLLLLIAASAASAADWGKCGREINAVEAIASTQSDTHKRTAALSALALAKRAAAERRDAACMLAVDQARIQLR
ncbi:MAG: hypothetical protein HY246_13965 [Proteobacteria bacterium]|nr:hypothetical protein [Pseudomonadota bacterium]